MCFKQGGEGSLGKKCSQLLGRMGRLAVELWECSHANNKFPKGVVDGGNGGGCCCCLAGSYHLGL